MAKRIKNEAKLRQKASARAKAASASDFALDVKQPRKEANRSYKQEAGSYRGAGRLERDALSYSISHASKALGPYRKQFKSDLREQRSNVGLGVRSGVAEARTTRRQALSDISATSAALRASRREDEHSIYQDLRANQRDKQQKEIEARKKRTAAKRERHDEKHRAKAENLRKHAREAKEAIQEIRSQVESAKLNSINAGKDPQKKTASLSAGEAREARKAEKDALRGSKDRRKALVRYLVTSQDKSKRAAEAAVARFVLGPKARKRGHARKPTPQEKVASGVSRGVNSLYPFGK